MMRPAEAPDPTASRSDLARVVFFVEDEREDYFGDPSNVFYVAEQIELLGALHWGSAFVVDLEPGARHFFEWDPYTLNVTGPQVSAVMTAELEAGHLYVVRLTTQPRSFFQTAVTPHFVASTFSEATRAGHAWLSTDTAAGRSWAAERRGKMQHRAEEAEAKIARGEFTTLSNAP